MPTQRKPAPAPFRLPTVIRIFASLAVFTISPYAFDQGTKAIIEANWMLTNNAYSDDEDGTWLFAQGIGWMLACGISFCGAVAIIPEFHRTK